MNPDVAPVVVADAGPKIPSFVVVAVAVPAVVVAVPLVDPVVVAVVVPVAVS